MRMSLVCVSAIRSSALRFVGSATRARLVPGPTCAPHFDRHLLQHASHAGLDLEVVELAARAARTAALRWSTSRPAVPAAT